jgi:putative transposase
MNNYSKLNHTTWDCKYHLSGDHVLLLISIFPKYAVFQVVGYLKWKGAIHIARTYAGRRHNFTGRNLQRYG